MNARFALVACFFLCAVNSFAQSADKEPVAVFELGGVADRSLKEGASSFGPTVAVEATPIENWLELELGVTPLFRRRLTEWNADLLFKKPWTLSRKTKFMLGASPEWIHGRENGMTSNSVGVAGR